MFISKRIKQAYTTDKAEKLINSLCKLCGGSRDNFAEIRGMLTKKYIELDEAGKLR